MLSSTLLAQSQYTAAEVAQSSDIRVIANFIKYNPNHPDTPKFKAKLYHLLNGGSSGSVASSPRAAAPIKSRVPASSKAAAPVDSKTQKTVDLLNHLFSSEKEYSKEAYILITNRSQCNIVVHISGKRNYHLEVLAQNSNFIQVDKGNYTLSADICHAQYRSAKTINRDTEIILNNQP